MNGVRATSVTMDEAIAYAQNNAWRAVVGVDGELGRALADLRQDRAGLSREDSASLRDLRRSLHEARLERDELIVGLGRMRRSFDSERRLRLAAEKALAQWRLSSGFCTGLIHRAESAEAELERLRDGLDELIRNYQRKT